MDDGYSELGKAWNRIDKLEAALKASEEKNVSTSKDQAYYDEQTAWVEAKREGHLRRYGPLSRFAAEHLVQQLAGDSRDFAQIEIKWPKDNA